MEAPSVLDKEGQVQRYLRGFGNLLYCMHMEIKLEVYKSKTDSVARKLAKSIPHDHTLPQQIALKQLKPL